jgi:hypothetical protein
MKITFDIDCTPAEARAFLGLPDITTLHDAWLARMQGLLTDGLTAPDLERMTRTWTNGMPGMAESFEKMQQLFWAGAGLGTGTGTGKTPRAE